MVFRSFTGLLILVSPLALWLGMTAMGKADILGPSLGTLFDQLYSPSEEALQPPGAVEQLLSDDVLERVNAAVELHRTRAAVRQGLLENLKKLSERPSRKAMDDFHVTVLTIGRWRIEEAVPTLAPMVGFNLDPDSFPVGMRLGEESFYPVARALVEIRGRSVSEELFRVLQQPASEQTLRASAWVLREILGEPAATEVVKSSIRDAETDAEKQNLSKVLELLADEGILQHPQL